jgi:hypothetical protein
MDFPNISRVPFNFNLQAKQRNSYGRSVQVKLQGTNAGIGEVALKFVIVTFSI